MKKLMLFRFALLFIIGFLSNGSLAKDYTQWHLPQSAKMRLGKGHIRDIKFSPNGTQFIGATSIGIWLYDAHTGTEIARLNEKHQNDSLLFRRQNT